MHRSGPLAAVRRAGMLFVVTACADGPIVRTVIVEEFVSDAFQHRNPVVPSINGGLPQAWQYVLPDSVTQFGLEAPRAIDALGPPACEILIADDIDDAIHRFGLYGDFRGSVQDVRSRQTYGVGAVAMDARSIWISYLASGEIAILDRTTDSTERFRTPPLSDSLVPYSLLAHGPDGTLLEHWMGILNHTWSGDWGPALPIIRWFARDGTMLGRAGSVRAVPGHVLTGALNRGFLGYAQDTVWFAEAAAAQVIAVPIERIATEWPGIAIPLPVAFRMRPPVEFRDRETGRSVARVEYHLTGFAVAPSAKTFAFGYVMSWPDPESRELYQPRTVLALYDRRASTLRAYDVGGRIWDVRMPTDDAVVILLTDSRLGRRVVRGYRVPQPTVAGAHTCTHDRA